MEPSFEAEPNKPNVSHELGISEEKVTEIAKAIIGVSDKENFLTLKITTLSVLPNKGVLQLTIPRSIARQYAIIAGPIAIDRIQKLQKMSNWTNVSMISLKNERSTVRSAVQSADYIICETRIVDKVNKIITPKELKHRMLVTVNMKGIKGARKCFAARNVVPVSQKGQTWSIPVGRGDMSIEDVVANIYTVLVKVVEKRIPGRLGGVKTVALSVDKTGISPLLIYSFNYENGKKRRREQIETLKSKQITSPIKRKKINTFRVDIHDSFAHRRLPAELTRAKRPRKYLPIPMKKYKPPKVKSGAIPSLDKIYGTSDSFFIEEDKKEFM